MEKRIHMKDCQAEWIALTYCYVEISKGEAMLEQGNQRGARAALRRAEQWARRARRERPR